MKFVGGPRRQALRLMELGLVPGTRVVLKRRAPLGDPIELHLRGYDLSIRNAEARHIEVERIEAPASAPVPLRVASEESCR